MKTQHTHITEIDIGNSVVCDVCNGDFTDSDESGGFLFGSNAYCPKCAEKNLPIIKGYGEERYIKAFCPENISFKDFVIGIRAGQNKITITTWK